MEQFGHGCLESGWGIREVEGYYKKLVMTINSLKSRHVCL